MRLNWTYAIVAVLATCLFFFALMTGDERIHACECVESDSASERLEEASAVFLGRVTDMHFQNWPFDIDSALVSPEEPMTVEFSVRTAWKGNVSGITSLNTARSGPCGFPFKKHEDYLVYADGEEGSFEVRACSRTKLAVEAHKDLEILGEGDALESVKRPIVRPATLDCYSSSKSAYAVTGTWPLLMIAGIVWFGFRKNRRR